jgi:L-threonylcarbamoyladenylate synthase
MNTDILPADSPEAIRLALQILRAGGLVAFPTDTVYGLGALAFDGPAVEAIYAAKERPPEKAIPVLIGELDQLEKVAGALTLTAQKLAQRFWPGPLTLVVPKHPGLPEAVSAAATVGVRMPDHQAARAILRAAGPLAVTSANRSGGTSPSTADEVLSQLGGRIPLILDGGPTPGGVASTVADCTGPAPLVLRAGPISLAQLLEALT